MVAEYVANIWRLLNNMRGMPVDAKLLQDTSMTMLLVDPALWAVAKVVPLRDVVLQE